MDGLALTGLVFILLCLGVLYHRQRPTLDSIELKLKNDRWAKFSLLLPLLFAITDLAAVLFFLLNFIYFFLLFTRFLKPANSILLAALASQGLVFITRLTAAEQFNNILLFLAATAAVSLLWERFKIKDSTVIALLVLMTMFDLVFVWLIPAIPTLEAAAQPLLFSPLVKVGSLTLGSGDVIFLLLTALTLTRKVTDPKLAVIYLTISSLSIPAALFVKNLPAIPNGSFPFLGVLTPIFLLLFWVARKKP